LEGSCATIAFGGAIILVTADTVDVTLLTGFARVINDLLAIGEAIC
jgi:hypothetical protein